MRRRTCSLVVFVVALAAAGSANAAPSSATGCIDADLELTASSAPRVEKAIVCRVNEERRAAGRRALRVDRKLSRAARSRTADMRRHDYFSHVDARADGRKKRAQGRDKRARLRRSARDGRGLGENIGTGPETANAVLELWMDSARHRANILSKRFRVTGVGATPGGRLGTLYTQVFRASP